MTVTIALDGQTSQGGEDHTGRPLHLRQRLRPRRAGAGDRARTRSRFIKQGKGPLYYSAYLTNFTLEDPITHAGLEIKVDRKVYRLVKDDKVVDVAGGRGQAVGPARRALSPRAAGRAGRP